MSTNPFRLHVKRVPAVITADVEGLAALIEGLRFKQAVLSPAATA